MCLSVGLEFTHPVPLKEPLRAGQGWVFKLFFHGLMCSLPSVCLAEGSRAQGVNSATFHGPGALRALQQGSALTGGQSSPNLHPWLEG